MVVNSDECDLIYLQMDPGDRVIRFLGKIEEESIHGY